MRTLIKAFTTFLKTCTICHGMGVREKPNGDTYECNACKGKGYL